MTSKQSDLVDVLETKDIYHSKFLRLSQARVRYQQSDGTMGDPVTRLSVDRGDAVGVLILDPARDEVVLVRQFRYPVYAAMTNQERQNQGAQAAWLLEIVAGVQEQGHSAEETARREVQEEIGFELHGQLEHVASFYSSPGAATERITVFIAEADTSSLATTSGGLADEGEDTELVRLSRTEALAMIKRGEICDSKTIIALQHVAIR